MRSSTVKCCPNDLKIRKMSTPRVLGWLPLQLLADIQIIALVAAPRITPVLSEPDYHSLTLFPLKCNTLAIK